MTAPIAVCIEQKVFEKARLTATHVDGRRRIREFVLLHPEGVTMQQIADGTGLASSFVRRMMHLVRQVSYRYGPREGRLGTSKRIYYPDPDKEK